MQGKIANVVSDLKKKIDGGVLTVGTKLPSTYQIAKNYGVAYPTAHKAIQELAKEGYVYRRQGEGTFVSKKNKDSETKEVGIFIRTEGHLFGKFAHYLLSSLQDAGYHSQVVSLGDMSNRLSISTQSTIERIISLHPKVIIAEFHRNNEYFELMKKAEGMGIRIIWTLYPEPPAGMSGDVVGPDLFAGYYKIAEHLVKLGHRRIAVYAIHYLFGPIDPFARALEQIKNNYPYVEFIPFHANSDYEQEDEDVTSRIKSMLEADQRPSAFLCSLDFRAKIVIDIARQLGLRVPEDLAVTGFFDTPWSQSYDITTVEIHPDKIAKGIVDMIEKIYAVTGTNERRGENRSLRMLIEPTLIVRGSTVKSLIDGD